MNNNQNQRIVRTTKCGRCKESILIANVHHIHPLLCLTKNGDKDIKNRDVLFTLSGIAWRRVCANCVKLCKGDDERLKSLCKSTLICVTSPGFRQFCTLYPDICKKYNIGKGKDRFKKIYIQNNTPDILCMVKHYFNLKEYSNMKMH